MDVFWAIVAIIGLLSAGMNFGRVIWDVADDCVDSKTLAAFAVACFATFSAGGLVIALVVVK